MPLIIDRYLMRALLRGYAACVIVIMAMLVLENLPRLAKAVEQVNTPMPLLRDLFATLLPEYLGIANPVAAYVSMAWLVRSLHQRGEWQIFAATGIRTIRIMAVPIAMGLLTTGLQLTVRGELQPRGERQLDTLLADIRSGAYGLDVPIGQIVQIGRDASFMADPGPDGLRSIFIRRPKDIITARSATLARAVDGSLIIDLHDGQLTTGLYSEATKSVRFGQLVVSLEPELSVRSTTGAAERMDRLTFAELQPIILREIRTGRPAIGTSSMLARLQNALFCIAIPWFGLIFAVPPLRRSGGTAILLGLMLLVLNLRSTAFVEQGFTSVPFFAAAIHTAIWATMTIVAVRLVGSAEPGAVDRGIGRAMEWIAASFRTRERPTQHGSRAARHWLA